MKILVLGSSTINKGAEAMLRTVQAELSQRIPGASFYIGDRRARQWRPDTLVEAGMSLAPTRPAGLVQRGLQLAAHAARAPEGPRYWFRERGRLAYLHTLADAVDAAVDVSGFLFSDQRGARVAAPLVPLVEVFAQQGKPFVFLPQAWGPFEDEAVRALTRRACTNASLVFARDTTSLGYLTDLLGGRTAVEQAPDIAFLFEGADDGSRLLAELGLDPARPIAAISPNMRVYERTAGDGEQNVYCGALARVGRELLDRGAQILLAPHEILPSGEDRPDDRYLCGLLADLLPAEGVAAVTDDRPAEDLKALIGGCDLMLGSRFHALIAALSSGVPSLAIGWAHKYPELLGEFGLEHLVFDHDGLTQDALAEAVLGVWDVRAEYRDRLAQRLPAVKARSAGAFDRVADLLNSRM